MPTSKPRSATLIRLLLLLMVCSGTSAWARQLPMPAGRSVLMMAEEEVRKELDSQAVSPAPSAAQPATPRRELAAPIPKPPLSGSTTGYVENAFVGSQIRLRFDAGFGIETPDRAEFFYAKCGCYRLAGIDPEAPGPVGVLPPGANPATTKLIENNLGYQEFQVYTEFAPHQRFSLFADVPVRSLSPSIIPDATGLGDIHAGVKLGLIASDTRALTFQFRSYFPTGDSEKGLGTAHASAEFTLLYHDLVAQRVSIGAELGTWHPINGSSAVPVAADGHFSGNVVRWGVGAGVNLGTRPDFGFAPVVELVGWRVLSGYESVTPDGTPAHLSIPSAEGTTIVNLKLGGRFTFNGRHSVYAGYGFPLTESDWYNDIFRLEYRFAF